MRQIFLITILSLCSLNVLKAQEYYAPIGTTWYYQEGVKCFVTDTFTKKNVHFSKLFFEDVYYSGVPSYTALGRDSTNKVYIYDTLRDTSYLFYDLNTQVSDTWNIYYPIDTDIVKFNAYTLDTGLVSPFGKGGKGIKFHINTKEVETVFLSFFISDSAFAYDTLGLFDHLILRTTQSYFPYYRWTPRCIDIPYFGTIKYNWDKACDYSTISVEEQINHSKIRVFPNPVSDILHLKIEDFNQARTFRLYDLSGQLALEQNIAESATSLDLSTLPKGMYFYELADKGNRISQGKIVKQ